MAQPKVIYRPSSFISISHGGGPMPLLGQDPDILKHWAMLKAKYFAPSASAAGAAKQPDVILVISAHYHSKSARVSGAPNPAILHDYGGFPPESYKIQFPAPDDSVLAERIFAAFKKHPELSANAVLDEKARWDHGVFVPMLGGFNPKAEIPVVAVSVSATDDAAMQLAIGEAIHDALNVSKAGGGGGGGDDGEQSAASTDATPPTVVVKNVMCIASGAPGHNFDLIFNPPRDGKIDHSFNDALKELLTDKKITAEDRKKKLLNWRQALPNSTVYQPMGGADHFMPLLSLAAAAGYQAATFAEDYLCFKYQVTDYIWKY